MLVLLLVGRRLSAPQGLSVVTMGRVDKAQPKQSFENKLSKSRDASTEDVDRMQGRHSEEMTSDI